jgi:glutathione S-transferase
MKLYDYILDADCYKVRLLLGFLDVPWRAIKLNVHPGRDHEAPWFRAINPCGKIPLLDDEGFILGNAEAILVYLATCYDDKRTWLPLAPMAMASVVQWLQFASGDLAPLGRARMRDLTGHMLQDDPDRTEGRIALEILEDHLWERELLGFEWVTGTQPTIADVAIFPPVALADEGGVSLETFPAIWRWVERLNRLPGFIVMPGIFPMPSPK